MFQHFEMKIDFDDVKAGLEITDRQQNKIIRRGLAKIGVAIRKDIRDGLKGKILKKKSGKLYNKISYKAGNDYSLSVRSGTYYSNFHEKQSGLILPSKGKYLTFKVENQWVKVKSVKLPARPFMKPVIDNYFNSNKAMDILDKEIQVQLDKIFKV